MKWAPDMSLIVTREIKRGIEQQDALERVRAERDRRLAATDWTMLEDAPADKARWMLYRKALRDLDLTSPAWPEPPEGRISDAEKTRIEAALDRAARTILFDGKHK